MIATITHASVDTGHDAPHRDTTEKSLGRPQPSFEQRRAIASARERLFGVQTKLLIGRFEVIGRLGAGGMGEVYLGLDAQLDRKVALKRVLADVGDERAQERLRREARALAKLSHANVVQIYEIGNHEDRLYIAMEYVEGQTLSEWLSAEPRSWRAILDCFVAAGRGLVAAHRAGVIHRDFKPDNVLISKQGDVRVADFGLALAGPDLRPFAAIADVVPSLGSASARLSSAGSIIGTIRYMPLEQLIGEPVDERSDQFAFCVALYEALWGQPPFSIASAAGRVTELERGEPVVPELEAATAPIWRAIQRGLARSPADRWPDMTSLLDALRERPSRWPWVASSALLGALGLGFGVLWISDRATQVEAIEPCSVIEHELDEVWSETQRAQLAAVFDDSKLAHASESRDRVLTDLDDWASAYVSERQRVCAAREAGTIDPELARLEGLCLARSRRQVVDLLAELSDGDASRLAGAVDVSAELADPRRCADELSLLGVPPPPRAIEAEVEQLRGDIQHAHDMRLLGRVEPALASIELAQARAETLGYGPVIAEAQAERAKAEFAAGTPEHAAELLELAIARAESFRHDRLAADLLGSAVLHAATDLEDPEAAARHLARAEVAWQRVEPQLRDQVRLELARGLVAKLERRDAAAESSFGAALTLLEDADLPERAAIHSALADLVRRKDPERAIEAREQALAAAERTWGPEHPQTAFYVYKLGHALERAGEHERGRPLIARAATLWTESLVRPHPLLATARASLAQVALAEGRYDDAEQQALLLEQAQQSLPEDHRDRGEPELIRSTTAALRGDRASALQHAERALAYWQPTLGDEHPRVIHVQTEIATQLLGLGRLDEANDRYRALLARELPPERALPVWLGVAEVELRLGRLAEAKLAIETIPTLGLASLGGHDLSIAVITAAIALRRGQLGREREQLAATLSASQVTAEQLDGWLDELGLDASERRELGL